MPTNKIFMLGIIILVIASVVGLSALTLPLYKAYVLQRRLARINPTLDELLQQFINFANIHGYLPTNQLALRLKARPNKDAPYIYRIKTWTSDPQYANTSIGQTAYLQGYLNGMALGLPAGYGGMFTCPMANKNTILKVACYYQVKEM